MIIDLTPVITRIITLISTILFISVVYKYIEFIKYKKQLCNKPYCNDCIYSGNYSECWTKPVLVEEKIGGTAITPPHINCYEVFVNCYKRNKDNDCPYFKPYNFIQFYFGVRVMPRRKKYRKIINE